MKLNKAQAARQAGISRTTLDNHLRKGLVSGEKDERGRVVIDVSELQRVYPDVSKGDTSSDVQEKHIDTSQDVQVRLAKAESVAEQLREERDDLRRRLDDESEERRKLTAMLTDERTQKRRGFWARLFAKQKQ